MSSLKLKKFEQYKSLLENLNFDNLSKDDKIKEFDLVYDKFKDLSTFVQTFEPHEITNALKYADMHTLLSRKNSAGMVPFTFKDIVMGSMEMYTSIENTYNQHHRNKSDFFDVSIFDSIKNTSLYKFLKFLMVLRVNKKTDKKGGYDKKFIAKAILNQNEHIYLDKETEAKISVKLESLEKFIISFIKTILYIPDNGKMFAEVLKKVKYDKDTANIKDVIYSVYFYAFDNIAKSMYSDLIKSTENKLEIDVNKTLDNLKNKGYIVNYKKSSPKPYLNDDTDEFIYINGVDGEKFDEKANIIWLYLVKKYSKTYLNIYGVDVYRSSYDRYRIYLNDMFDKHNSIIKSCFAFK